MSIYPIVTEGAMIKFPSSQGNYKQYSPREYISPSQGQQIISAALFSTASNFPLSLPLHPKFILSIELKRVCLCLPLLAGV